MNKYLKNGGTVISANDLVKYITEQVVTYMNTPADERKKRKRKPTEQTIYTNRWLGIVPFALKTMWKKAE